LDYSPLAIQKSSPPPFQGTDHADQDHLCTRHFLQAAHMWLFCRTIWVLRPRQPPCTRFFSQELHQQFFGDIFSFAAYFITHRETIQCPFGSLSRFRSATFPDFVRQFFQISVGYFSRIRSAVMLPSRSQMVSMISASLSGKRFFSSIWIASIFNNCRTVILFYICRNDLSSVFLNFRILAKS